MSDEDWTPAAIEPYEDDFEDVLRVLELSSGFVLVPIAVLGPDLAEMLADWLGHEKRPVTRFVAEGPEDWKNLSSSLLSAKPDRNGVVMVIAGIRGDDLSLGLRLINERRDAIAKHLNCPLLWCGSAEFLVQTGQLAPDFWSVRAVERRIEARRKTESKKTPPKKDVGKENLLDEALRQGDRKSAEILFLSRLREAMANGGDDDFDAVVASIPAEYEKADPSFEFELTLMKAEMARRRYKIGAALELLDTLEEKIKTPDEECRVDLLRGRIWEQEGNTERAKKAYESARETPGLENELWGEIAAQYYRIFHIRTANADLTAYQRSSLHRIKSIGDAQLRSLTTAFLAEATARQHDGRRAQRLLREAIELHDAAKDEPTILFGGEAAEAIQRAKLVIEKTQEPHRAKVSAILSGAGNSPLGFVMGSIVFALLAVGLVAMTVAISKSNYRRTLHCFQGPNDKIICAESLEQCEKLRAIENPESTKPCQRPLTPK